MRDKKETETIVGLSYKTTSDCSEEDSQQPEMDEGKMAANDNPVNKPIATSTPGFVNEKEQHSTGSNDDVSTKECSDKVSEDGVKKTPVKDQETILTGSSKSSSAENLKISSDDLRRKRSSKDLMKASSSNELIQLPDHPHASRFTWLFVLLLETSLVGLLFGYAFMGGAVFVALEQPHEMEQYRKFVNAREVLKQTIANLSGFMSQEDMFNETLMDSALEIFAKQMRETVCEANVNINGQPKWTYWSSVFFSATVISTIGKITLVIHNLLVIFRCVLICLFRSIYSMSGQFYLQSVFAHFH